jgi:hypothetical protein
MRNAIILHGTGDSPDLFWFPYIANGPLKYDFSNKFMDRKISEKNIRKLKRAGAAR